MTILLLKYNDCRLIIPMSSRYYWEENFERFTVATMAGLTVMAYQCHKWKPICSTCRNLFPQDLITRPEHQRSPPGISGVRVTRSLVLYVCFVDRCLSFFPFFLLAIVLSVLLWYTDSDYSLVSSHSSYIISDRNEVAAADNPKPNDTYEFIEGATSNQTKKGRNYNIDLLISKLVGSILFKVYNIWDSLIHGCVPM